MTNTGKGQHTNIFNFYEQSDQILVWGNKARDCIGYGTWQEASRIVWGFNDIQLGDSSGRAVEDQTNSTLQPTIPSLNYVIHNALLPNLGIVTDKFSSLVLGDHYVTSFGSANQPNNISFVVENNIIHGGGVSEPYVSPGTGETHWRDQPGYDDTHIERRRDGNIFTGLNFWQTGAYGWSARSGEVVNTDLSQVYTNAGTNDFTAPVGSPIKTTSGIDISSTISECQALFPSFDFFRDADGYAFDPTLVKPGPYQSDWDTQIAWA